ncbi:MAG: Hsp20/alpha crystallin family protein [Fibrobacter sp.]|nr:Hsp20/alpha crystallin family protein [Fibrobacter sp.]
MSVKKQIGSLPDTEKTDIILHDLKLQNENFPTEPMFKGKWKQFDVNFFAKGNQMTSQYMVRISCSLQKDIEEAFSDLIHTRWSVQEASWCPPVDLFETEDEYIIVIDLPGVDISALELKIEQKRVTLCGQRKIPFSDMKNRHLFIERSHGQFCRIVDLPGAVNMNKTKTNYNNGLYEIFLPKVDKSSIR